MLKVARRIVLGVSGCLLAGSIVGAQAAEFPTKPVHFLVGYPAGSGVDVLARVVGEYLSEKWKQPVVVENRTGGDGEIAASVTVAAPPDGYTVVWVSVAHAVAPSQNKLPYDSVKSFAPIMQVAYVPDVLLIGAKLKVDSLKELIVYAKANPGKLNFGTSGAASAPFLETAALMQRTGISMVHVPYQGGPDLVTAMLNGEIDLRFAAMPPVKAFVEKGAFKALAIATAERWAPMPNIPTIAEALGIDKFEAANADWIGALTTGGTPKDVVAQLNRDMLEAVKSRVVIQRFNNIGAVPVGDSPEHFTATLESEIPRWAGLLSKFNPK